MQAEEFIRLLNADFFTGVPDSRLKALCDCLLDSYGTDPLHHIIAANEGNCAALAAGYHLATGKTPVVYLQNSGEGNIVNPVASLLHDDVYGIPVIFIVGWRGEPGMQDEPQHVLQGKITLKLLELLDITAFVVGRRTMPQEIAEQMEQFRPLLTEGKQVAFVIQDGAFQYLHPFACTNRSMMRREDVIRQIAAFVGEGLVVSTTGKASRELYEIQEANGQGHKNAFLTIGSMGHCSSIALGLALHRPEKKVWCIDGDGSALMHMGAMTVIGACKPLNMVHIVLNNGSHESVGGMPTVAEKIDFPRIALGCGYPQSMSAVSQRELDDALVKAAKENELTFLEVKCAVGSRKGLGRPGTSMKEQKEQFMQYSGAGEAAPGESG